jgi:hypothetical protein
LLKIERGFLGFDFEMIKLGFFGAFFSTATTFFVFGFTRAAAIGVFLTVAARVGGDSLQKIKKKKKKKSGEE